MRRKPLSHKDLLTGVNVLQIMCFIALVFCNPVILDASAPHHSFALWLELVLNCPHCFFFSSVSSEKEAEKAKERLAQEEAEAMEMEDEENKAENTNNEKEVCGEQKYPIHQ